MNEYLHLFYTLRALREFPLDLGVGRPLFFFMESLTHNDNNITTKFPALLIYSRSPAAFLTVKSLKLPCDKIMRKFMHQHNTSCGIEQSLLLNAKQYDQYKSEQEKGYQCSGGFRVVPGVPPPLWAL